MQIKKLILILPFIVLCAAAWIVCVASINTDHTKEQKALIEKADVFLADKAYIRAIPLYRKAYELEGTLKDAAAGRLIEAYKRNGDTKTCYSFMDKRCAEGTAGESEYVDLALYYFSVDDYKSAMNCLNKGVKVLGSNPNIEKLFYSHKYDTVSSGMTFKDLVLTPSDYTPVFDGENWGYANKLGNLTVKCVYNKATPFGGGLAAVKNGSEYELINKECSRYALCKDKIKDIAFITPDGNYVAAVRKDGKYQLFNSDFIACDFVYDRVSVMSDGLYPVCLNGKWGAVNGRNETVIDFQYGGFAVNKYGESFNKDRVFIKTGKGYIMTDTKANMVSDTVYEDARAFYANGEYAAVKNNGKWGFVDTKGNIVIDYQYRDADSFSYGLAAVNTGFGWSYTDEYGIKAADGKYIEAGPFNKYGAAFVRSDSGWYTVIRKWNGFN